MTFRLWSTVLNLIAVVAACGLSSCSERAESNNSGRPSHRIEAPAADVQPVSTTSSITNRAGGVAVSGRDSSDPRITGDARSNQTEADFARSSWEDPFHPRLWDSNGWRIDNDSMRSESPLPATVTFFRPYRNLVISCQLTRPESPKTSRPLDSRSSCELRLMNQSTGGLTSLVIDTDRVALIESSQRQTASLNVIREVSLDAREEPGEFVVRLTLTPNRILVAINGQLRINTARPATIRNTRCLAQFVGHESEVTVRDLRFEGN